MLWVDIIGFLGYIYKVINIVAFIFGVAIIKNKTKEQLLEDIKILKDRINKLEHNESEHEQLKTVLQQLAKGVSGATGDAFFRMLVQHLVRILGVDYAFVAKLIGKCNDRVRTVAVCIRGEISENFEYDLADTPCRNVIQTSPCYYPNNVQQLFPKDKMLIDMGVESYVGVPLFGSNGHVMGLIVILHTNPLLNIHIVKSVFQIFAARAAAEMERMQIEEGHALLSAAVEQSTECVVITDLDGIIVYVNPAFERNTGYSAAEAIGKKPSILKSEKHSPEYFSKLWFALKSRGAWSGILINKRKDGTLFEEETSISTVSDSNGRPAYYVAVKKDVTNERRLEEQLRHAQKMEAIGQLTGGIAHDFNNFLTAILGFSSLLQMKFDNDKDAQSNSYLQNIISAAEKAANMTSSLLAFSRKRIINIRPALLNDIVSGIEKLLQRVITENVELKTALTDKGTIIMVDTGQIEQVLLNLVANARDSMPKGGTVFIKTEIVHLDEAFVGTYGYGKPGAYVLLSVSDTGIGMDEMTKERIFDPFFTTKEAGKGTGLGLSIVYGIVRQHNGYIDVNSESGKGTTFNIYLPIIESTIEPYEAITKAAPKGGTETILLAEDELEVRRLVKTVLEEFGYKVIEAVDGDDAINRFKENKDRIDMVILDVIMPMKNGREVYNEIKDSKPDIKTIFISGYTEDIIKREDIFEMGLNFISKPVSPTDLLKRIKEVMDK